MWSKQKTKLQINIFLIVFLIFSTAISGCIKTPSDSSVIPSNDYKVSSTPPTTQVISGVNQVIDISGETIIVGGRFNKVRIINTNISKIIVSGTDNIVFYPTEANPAIVNSGLRNEIKTY